MLWVLSDYSLLVLSEWFLNAQVLPESSLSAALEVNLCQKDKD